MWPPRQAFCVWRMAYTCVVKCCPNAPNLIARGGMRGYSA
ncbi:hypothetical protein SXCC_03156 [Gluconacetobacter sp. SXCC-1]|nr:hypothetical protein SXCC_03156 [Gluconacetobacter sp. SXCC-1]